MLEIIRNLFAFNNSLLTKAKAITTYQEALALHVAKEYKAALPLMIQAAELGSTEAMTVLGSMYLQGQGIQENGTLALKWLQNAVNADSDEAVSILGMAYATGKAGVKVDISKAIEMLTYAADKGDEQSLRMLRMMENGQGMFSKLKREDRAKAKR